MDKVTVNVTSTTSAALDATADSTEETKTSVINRAVMAYAFLTRMHRDGWEIILRHPADGREQRVEFL